MSKPPKNITKPLKNTTFKSNATVSAQATTGCCNVTFADGTGEQYENMTEDDCRQKAADLGGAAQWVAGECA